MSLPKAFVIEAIEVFIQSLDSQSDLTFHAQHKSPIQSDIVMKRSGRSMAIFPCRRKDTAMIISHFTEDHPLKA